HQDVDGQCGDGHVRFLSSDGGVLVVAVVDESGGGAGVVLRVEVVGEPGDVGEVVRLGPGGQGHPGAHQGGDGIGHEGAGQGRVVRDDAEGEGGEHGRPDRAADDADPGAEEA